MARKFKKGDFVRVSQKLGDQFTGLRNYIGVVFRVTGENHDYDGRYPYWAYVERYPSGEGEQSFWEGFLELDPFLGNAWRAKKQCQEK